MIVAPLPVAQFVVQPHHWPPLGQMWVVVSWASFDQPEFPLCHL